MFFYLFFVFLFCFGVQYNICSPSWTEFVPETLRGNSHPPVLYSETQNLIAPPLALPAILAFLTLANHFPFKMHSMDFPNAPSSSDSRTLNRQEVTWDDEWARCFGLGQTSVHKYPSGAFAPGSIQGIWEGIFTVRRWNNY